MTKLFRRLTLAAAALAIAASVGPASAHHSFAMFDRGKTIEIEGTVQLTVNVHDEQGQPLAGARLQLTPARKPGSGMGFETVLMVLPRPPSPPGTFREVEAGRYVLDGLGAGLYDVSARVANNAITPPIRSPAAARRNPCPTTSHRTLASGAPSATLIPISRARPRASCASTP